MLYKNAELHNIRALQPLPQGGFRLSRVPEGVRKVLNEGAQNTAFNTCGCEIRFNLRGGAAKVTLRRTARGEVPVDPCGVAEVWFGPFEGGWDICPRSIAPEPTTLTIQYPQNHIDLQRYAAEASLPYNPALVRVILPYDWPTELLDIEGDIEPPRLGQSPDRRILMYGSSITHGGGAVRPTESYAMLTAAQLGCDLINLGFAGSAQMEKDLARFIADDVDWDIATLEMGINVLGAWPVEKFREHVSGFVAEIAAKHPDRWIFCIDLFTCVHDFTHNPLIDAYRAIVRETVETMKMPKLVYLNGHTLLTRLSGLTSDLVHPSSEGMQEIASRLVQVIQDQTGR
jgi:lysophospholipase L1-like esterase